MTIEEWLHLSPNNTCTLQADGDGVRAFLYSDDAPERWRGKGDNKDVAIENALKSRDKVRSQLP